MGTDSTDTTTREPARYTARQMVYAYLCGALFAICIFLFAQIIR